MSRLESAVACDGQGCKNRSFDFMDDGWISFFGQLSKFKGRGDQSGDARVHVCVRVSSGDEHHYCSWSCMLGAKAASQLGKKSKGAS